MRRILTLYVFVSVLLSWASGAHTQDVFLKVLDGGGYPGSTGNVVPIFFRNEKPVDGCRFILLSDTYGIVVRDVTPGNNGCATWIRWDPVVETTVKVSTGSISDPSSGILAYIVFDVRADSPLGDYSLLLLSVHVFPETLNVKAENGTFSVRHAILAARCTAGVPGGPGKEIAIELMNDRIVDECQFDLHFDADVLTVTDVLSPAHTQWKYSWSPIDGGIRVTKTAGTDYLLPTAAPIARIVCNVAEEAPYGDNDIGLDSLAVTDSLGNPVSSVALNGIFTVTHALFSVTHGKGLPGGTGNNVCVNLENDTPVEVVAMDLIFDKDHLSVTDVAKTERARKCLFGWGSTEEGVRMVLFDCSGPVSTADVSVSLQAIDPDTGAVFKILFDVAENAPPGQYEVVPFCHELSDRMAKSIPFSLEHGVFSILLRGDVNNDGEVDIQDALLTVDIILGLNEATPDELLGADCNVDGVVNILDVVCIVKIILNS